MMWLTALAAEAAHGDTGKAAFPPFETWHFPSQLFWLTILFGGLYIVLSTWILPKLGGVIEKRGDAIATDLDEAARLSDQATEAQQALELSLAQARNSARETANEARAKMEAEIATETRKVDDQVATKIEAAEAAIAKTREKALSNVAGIAADAAKSMTERFGVNVSDSAVNSAVSSALKS